MRKILAPHLFAALLALVRASNAIAADATVEIDNFTFKPDKVTIHAGDNVVFKNRDDIPHSVVLVDGHARSPALDTNETARLPFAKVGTYPYFCGLHPHMTGTVIVVP